MLGATVDPATAPLVIVTLVAAVLALGGAVIAAYMTTRTHTEVKSPNGTTSGNVLHDVAAKVDELGEDVKQVKLDAAGARRESREARREAKEAKEIAADTAVSVAKALRQR